MFDIYFQFFSFHFFIYFAHISNNQYLFFLINSIIWFFELSLFSFSFILHIILYSIFYIIHLSLINLKTFLLSFASLYFLFQSFPTSPFHQFFFIIHDLFSSFVSNCPLLLPPSHPSLSTIIISISHSLALLSHCRYLCSCVHHSHASYVTDMSGCVRGQEMAGCCNLTSLALLIPL